jgi:hypothetical protein
MCSLRSFLPFYLILLSVISANAQTAYYIDAVSGNDNNAGTSSAAPYKNLSKIYNTTFSAGTRIYLKAGSVWNGQQLKFKGSGTSSSPIIVDKYGSGAKPVINGNGLTGQGVVYLYNQEYIEVNNLEITNSPNGPNNADFFVGLYDNTVSPNPNPLGADRRGVMVAIDNFGTADHIWLKNLDIHHIKGQLGNGNTDVNGATPKRTGGIYFTVLGVSETTSKKSRFNDVLIDSCNIYYCENIGLAFDNEWNVYYPGGRNSSLSADRTEYQNWYDRRFSSVLVRNNVIHHIGKNAMIIRCTDSTGLVEKNVCYETALGTTGNTIFTARAKGTVFQYNEGYYNRATTQTVDPGNIDGSMYDPDFGSVDVIFQYSYSHDNSQGLYWGCNTRSATNNTSGNPDPGDVGCTLRYCISQNDQGDLIFLNYPSAGNEIYNNVFFIGSGTSPNVIHESSTKDHTYNFFNNIIYNNSSATNGADYAFGSGAGIQTRRILNNIFYGSHPAAEPADSFKLITNPLFVNPGSGGTGISTLSGYKLQYGSPAYFSGRLVSNNGGLDFWGNAVSSTTAPNRGAYSGALIGMPGPTIISFSPATGPAGTVIQIAGRNFTGMSSVRIGGVNASTFSVINDTLLSATVGSGATGKITLANVYGTDSSSNIFTFCTAPAAPSASGATVCIGSSATLTASGVGTIKWYDASSGGNVMATGNSFTTPVLSTSRTYYAEDNTCLSSTSRTAVTVTVFASTNTATSVSSCNNYTWNGTVYTSSGTYYRNYTNSNGCASVDTLRLTISSVVFVGEKVASCNAYTWHNTLYTATGTYLHSYQNQGGCTSVDTLYLTILQGTHRSESTTACDNYFWRGNNYSASGTYVYNYLNQSGCASTDTLYLTINKSSASTEQHTVCANFTWHGVVYASSGTYYYNYVNEKGCPSTDTLILKVN